MTISGSEGSNHRQASYTSSDGTGGSSQAGAAGATSGQAAAAGTPGGLFGDGDPKIRLAAEHARTQKSTNSAEVPQLRPPEDGVPRSAQMIYLKALMEQFTEAMVEATSRNIDATVESKNNQAEEFVKKVEELARKLREAKDAANSWVNKLPGWVMGVATAVGVCLLAVLAVSAVVASGGAAAAPLMAMGAAMLSLAGATSLVQALGTIGWNVEGHEGSLGFAALEKSGVLNPGEGALIDSILKADFPGMVASASQALGTDDPHKLMIIGAVMTAVSIVVMIGTFIRAAPKMADAADDLKKVADGAADLTKYARAAGNFAQVTSGAASGAQAGVTAKTSSLEADATRAQAEQDRAQILMDSIMDLLVRLIKFSSELVKADATVTESVTRVLKSESHTASQLVAQPA